MNDEMICTGIYTQVGNRRTGMTPNRDSTSRA